MQLGLLQEGAQEIQAGFNKDDGMEKSISGAGLGQVFPAIINSGAQ